MGCKTTCFTEHHSTQKSVQRAVIDLFKCNCNLPPGKWSFLFYGRSTVDKVEKIYWACSYIIFYFGGL